MVAYVFSLMFTCGNLCVIYFIFSIFFRLIELNGRYKLALIFVRLFVIEVSMCGHRLAMSNRLEFDSQWSIMVLSYYGNNNIHANNLILGQPP